MRRKLLALTGAVVAASAAAFAIPVAAQAPSAKAASAASKAAPATSKTFVTPWGDPDLQGRWTNNRGVPLENPATVAKLGLAPKADTFNNYNTFWGDGVQRAKQVALVVDPSDGIVPLKPGVRAAANAQVVTKRSLKYVTQTWEDRDTLERCISRGMPGAMMGGFYNHTYQITQSPGYVAILIEMIHDARIIPLVDGPKLPENVGLWMGDSRGHWEGKTLVVETDHFNGKVRVANQNITFGITGTGRLVERFTRVDADNIDYKYTVEDPTYFTRPWTVQDAFLSIESPIYEFACHEGNYAMQDILAGARETERAAAGNEGGKK